MQGMTLACLSWSIYRYPSIIWWYCSYWAARFWSKTGQYHPILPPGVLDPALWTFLDEIKVLDQSMLWLVHPFPPPSLRMGDGSNHPCNTNHSLGHYGWLYPPPIRKLGGGKWWSSCSIDWSRTFIWFRKVHNAGSKTPGGGIGWYWPVLDQNLAAQ